MVFYPVPRFDDMIGRGLVRKTGLVRKIGLVRKTGLPICHPLYYLLPLLVTELTDIAGVHRTNPAPPVF